MLRLFGSGAEILEAGRQRRSVLHFNIQDGPILAVIQMVGGWDFALYSYDCDPGGLSASDVENLAQGVVLRSVGQPAPRLEEVQARHPSHPAVLLALGQLSDFFSEFEAADDSFALALEQVPHSRAVRAAANQRRKHEQLLQELMTYPDILIHDNPGLTRTLMARAVVLERRGRRDEAWAVFTLIARFDPKIGAALANMDSVRSVADALLGAMVRPAGNVPPAP
jgi:hypothetical protein